MVSNLVLLALLKVFPFQHLGSKKFTRYIFLLDQVGSSMPKFSGRTDLNRIQEDQMSSFSLTCPAQGSPVPNFR